MQLLRSIWVKSSLSEIKPGCKRLAGLLLALFACGAHFAASGQAPKPCPARGDLAIAKDKPAVYITFEREAEFSPAAGRMASGGSEGEQKPSGEKVQGIWLGLHNNTRWAISFPTESLYLGAKTAPLRLCDGNGALGLREGTEVTALTRSDLFSVSFLPPGGSVIFFVPRSYLKGPLAIYLLFAYEWEMENGHTRADEPEHRVYFRSWNLPEHLR
jgi:hypothetical protein